MMSNAAKNSSNYSEKKSYQNLRTNSILTMYKEFCVCVCVRARACVRV